MILINTMIINQCFHQTTPLRESPVAIREDPQKKEEGQFSPLVLQGCMQA